MDYSDAKTPRMTNAVAAALRGRPITAKDRLKLAGTEVLALVDSTGTSAAASNDTAALAAKRTTSHLDNPSAAAGPTAPSHNAVDLDNLEALLAESAALMESIDGMEDGADEAQEQLAAADPAAPIEDAANDSRDEDIDDAELKKPYTEDLDFLEDQFQMVTAQIKLSRETLKRDMREVIGEDEKPSWDRQRQGVRTNLKEFEAKLRLMKTKVQIRLTETAAALDSALLPAMPRLVVLCERLGLNDFEQSVIVLLIGNTVSPMMKEVLKIFDQSMDKYGGGLDVTVKLIIQVFCHNFRDQVAHRAYFYKNSRLLRTGIIRMGAASYGKSQDGDLTGQTVTLDRRMLDWIVGLDTEINEVVEGTNLYTPSVQLATVVLPEEQKTKIMSAVTSYTAFKAFKRRKARERAESTAASASNSPVVADAGAAGGAANGARAGDAGGADGSNPPDAQLLHSDVPDVVAGLVFLFSGPSGTGKTMTVNAIADHLKKRVLLVNFNAMVASSSDRRNGSGGGAVQSLFREASMHDAIVFFDECESLFAQRGAGGSSQLTELLTEIERHDGMIFLATNRPFDLDEAMHRRITASFDFRAPHWLERRKIWQLHANTGCQLASDIDWQEIALRYELAGGFIKNAMHSALLKAVSREGPENPIITRADVEEGCALQMRGSLRMKSFRHRVVPTAGLEQLVLTDLVVSQLQSVVDLEKARGILMGQWGFDERGMRDQQSTTVLLWGPSGTGKSATAEALGFEIGRPLKVLSISELVGGANMSAESAINSAFKDAALMGAVMAIEGFESVMAPQGRHIGSSGGSSISGIVLDQLMFEMDRFRGVVVVIVSARQPFAQVCHVIDPDLVRRFKIMIELKLPTPAQRAELWAMMVPSKAPVAKDVDFAHLGESFDFNGGQISRVVYRAAARAAVRPVLGSNGAGESSICMDDFVRAAQAEESKTIGDMAKMVQQCTLPKNLAFSQSCFESPFARMQTNCIYALILILNASICC